MNFTTQWMKKNLIVPLPIPQNGVLDALYLGMKNPYNELILEQIRFSHKGLIIPLKMEESDILRTIRKQHSDLSFEFSKESENSWESEPIINLVDSLIDKAIEEKASDIHIEPMENDLKIRFRIDGLLNLYQTLPNWLKDSILVRLKLLAQVDITDKRIPHDGSFVFKSSLGPIKIRLSTLPIQYGETCVLRLLPTKEDGQTLKDLEFSPIILSKLQEIFNKPQGLFLITGPTGSGKTTTLYAGLREIIQKKINVTTIEDPVEYNLNGANQVQVNEKWGFTFSCALRSILRQDPDVILVGEIRDEETARIAIRAAETGHLVLSTLHTNSAKDAIKRLEDLGISPALLEGSLIGVAAQRLLRKKTGGRIAAIELYSPDGTYAEGKISDCAYHFVNKGIVDKAEVQRVLGI